MNIYHVASLKIELNDLEITIIIISPDEIRNGPYRSLFHPNQIISSKEDASNCYARGFYTLGRELLEETMENVRRQVESCERIQSFFVFHSFGGGTGSGFTSLLLDHIAQEFSSKTRLACAIYPSPTVCSNSAKYFLISFYEQNQRSMRIHKVLKIAMLQEHYPLSYLGPGPLGTYVA